MRHSDFVLQLAFTIPQTTNANIKYNAVFNTALRGDIGIIDDFDYQTSSGTKLIETSNNMSEYTNLISHYRNRTKIYEQKIKYDHTALTRLGTQYFIRYFISSTADIPEFIVNIP